MHTHTGAAGTSTSFDWAPQASLEEMMEGTGASLSVYDEAALCSSAFRVLRSVVNAWLNEVTSKENYYADLQLQHFYRRALISLLEMYLISGNFHLGF